MTPSGNHRNKLATVFVTQHDKGAFHHGKNVKETGEDFGEEGFPICNGTKCCTHLTHGLQTFYGFLETFVSVLLGVADLQQVHGRIKGQGDPRLGGIIRQHAQPQCASFSSQGDRFGHRLCRYEGRGRSGIGLGGSREESIGAKDHAGGTDQDLIAILEFIRDLRQQTFPLYHYAIRRLEIFDTKCIATPHEPSMAATDMVLGQTEETLGMTPNVCFLGQQKTFSTVESLKYFQARHSFYLIMRPE
jgi:hypothetical protein